MSEDQVRIKFSVTADKTLVSIDSPSLDDDLAFSYVSIGDTHYGLQTNLSDGDERTALLDMCDEIKGVVERYINRLETKVRD